MHGTGTLQIGSEPAGRLAEATADVHRLRVLLEGAFDVLSGPASVLTPSLEVGGRYDGGAAETGAGLEVGGGVRYAHPAWGLTVAANGRVLLTHQDRGFREWGAGVSVRVAPGSAGRGPSLTLNSAWGNTSKTRRAAPSNCGRRGREYRVASGAPRRTRRAAVWRRRWATAWR